MGSIDEWRLASPASVPATFDINMDNVFVIPQLSADNFAYTRLPHVSHGVFCAGPIGGTFAMPQSPSDQLVSQLRAQHLAQSTLYGRAPSAVAHIPPPPGRARSQARAVSRARAAPVDPPAQRQFVLVSPLLLFFASSPSVPSGDTYLTRMGQLLSSFSLTAELPASAVNVLPVLPQRCWNSKLLGRSGLDFVPIMQLKMSFSGTRTNLCQLPPFIRQERCPSTSCSKFSC